MGILSWSNTDDVDVETFLANLHRVDDHLPFALRVIDVRPPASTERGVLVDLLAEEAAARTPG